MGVVVVGVPHGPAADVSAGVLTVTAVYKAVVTVRPFLEIVHLTHLQHSNSCHFIIYIYIYIIDK